MSEILRREGPQDPKRTCNGCQIREGSWRCKDCIGDGCYCFQCFREGHRLLPFHQVEQWSGTHYEPAWLCQAGVFIQLGHHGHRCPGPDTMNGQQDATDINSANSFQGTSEGHDSDRDPSDAENNADTEDESIHSDWEDEDYSEPQFKGTSALPILKGPHARTVVDTSGVHRIKILPCCCSGAPPLDVQMLRAGFFPTSFITIKTVITFRALEDQRLDNLECKTALLKYWNKLKRKTSGHLWLSVPVSSFRSEHSCRG